MKRASGLVIFLLVGECCALPFAQSFRLPGMGTIRATTTFAPGSLPEVRFVNAAKKELLKINVGQENPDFFRVPATGGADAAAPFSVVLSSFATPGRDRGGVLVIAMEKGGSDCMYEATAVGSRAGRLEAWLKQDVTTHAEGGLYMGPLGAGRGYGLATWDFVWGDEPHVAPHHYRVRLFRLDAGSGQLVQQVDLTTKRTYDSGEAAQGEFGMRYPNLLRLKASLHCG